MTAEKPTSKPSPQTSGAGKVAKNTALNIVGRIIPLIVAFITIPPVIQHLGEDSFAILSLAWVLLIYFAFFDLGLGQAVTKYVAEGLGRKDTSDVPKYVWTSFWIQCLFGLIGAAILAGITPYLMTESLNVPEELVGDAQLSFYILSASVPFVLLGGLFRGVLAGGERFDVINYIQVPSTSAVYLLTLVGVWLGFGLPAIFVLLLISRAITFSLYLFYSLKLFPELRQGYKISKEAITPLFRFGGWLTISGLIGPLLIYSERFMIGSILTMTALTYYTVPHEIVTRIWILPFGLMTALFPAFSSMSSAGNISGVTTVIGQAMKFLMLVVGPVVLVLFIFSQDILTVWLDEEFATQSTTVLQVLLVGILFSTMAQLPYTFFQGIGRPDVTCFIQMTLVPITIGLGWFMITNYGIVGAAFTWLSIRILAMIIGFTVYRRFAPLTIQFLRENRLFHTATLLIALTAALLPLITIDGLNVFVKMGFTGAALLIFSPAAWFHACDDSDREVLNPIISKLLPRRAHRAKGLTA